METNSKTLNTKNLFLKYFNRFKKGIIKNKKKQVNKYYLEKTKKCHKTID